MEGRPLTPRQLAFVAEYLVDLNGTQAAIRAGYSPHTANEQAARLLAKASIQAAIREAMAARSARTEISADAVLRELWAIGTADPGELIEFRRGACRYCYGRGHRYQETAAELEARHGRWILDKAAAGDDLAKLFVAFDAQGGTGFDPRKAPHPDCPECFGEGIGQAHIKDTRTLSDDARRLYAGVKVTREGVDLRMHDKQGALIQVGRHLGMFTDKIESKVEISHEDALAELE